MKVNAVSKDYRKLKAKLHPYYWHRFLENNFMDLRKKKVKKNADKD